MRGHVQGPDTRVATAAYQPEPTAAAAARRFVRDTLQTWLISGAAADGHGLVDDAVLLTSELVTNAVVHAGTPVEVTCKLTEGGVEVVVSDGHPARLVPEPPENEHIPAERTSGRGLLLPAALASAWGVTYGRAAKAVWFRIGQPGPGPELSTGGSGRPDGLGAVLEAGLQAGGGPVDGPAALAAALRQTSAASQPGADGETARANGSPRWPVPSLGDPGYAELLASTVESARAAAGADAAYALMADEDGDLSLRAAAGRFPALVPGPDAPDAAGPAGMSLAAARAAAGAAPSVVTVPFVVDGRVTGLLAAAAATSGRFRDDEAARLQQLADRCGPPLERARLSELERVRRGRIGALAQARGLLAGSFDQDEVMAVAGRAAVPRLVPWCAVLLPGSAPPGPAVAALTRPGAPGAPARLRTVYARHVDEARSVALAWLLDRACEGTQKPEPPRASCHGLAWRWPLAVPGLAKAPAGAAELAGDTAWCFPLAHDGGTGVLAVGHQRDERLPREVVELAADLACRIGVALDNARRVSQDR